MEGIKLKRILFLTIFLISGPIFAKYNFRHCLLLPIIETGGEALGYNLFLELERYLKKGNWCYYESNSQILDVLNRYQENLGQYLENPDVLKIISGKTNAGSLIKISLINRGDSTILKMKVIGENGLDLLFQDEKELTSDREKAISLTAIDWLNQYAKKIPYDGRVLKVSGEKLEINVGENLGMARGSLLNISRAVGKKKHPILDEVVWEKRDIGTAEIIEVRPTKSIAEMKEYLVNEKPQVDDWAITGIKAKSKALAPQAKEEQRARFGYISLALDMGSSSQTVDYYNSAYNFNNMGFGGRLKGEVWLTENWWAGADLAARFTSSSPHNNNYNYYQENSEIRGYMKVKGGYRFLPTGFFSGPQIDLFVGYGGYFYQPDYVNAFGGPIDANFYGVLIGVKGGLPIGQYFRTSLYFDLLFSTNRYQKGGPGYFLELMFNYLFKTYLSFDASFSGWGNNWRDVAPYTDVRYNDLSFLLGATYYF